MKSQRKYVGVGAIIIVLALVAVWMVAGLAGVAFVLFIPAYASFVAYLWSKNSRWAKAAAIVLLPALLLANSSKVRR